MEKTVQGFSASARSKGFTLVELLVVIAIVSILAAVVILIINPLELMKQGRDATRLTDLNNLQSAINTALGDAATSTATVLCYNLTAPCSANSNDTGANIRKNDGTGWVKVNFAGQAAIKLATLPIDPTNDSTDRYSYYSDGSYYELNAVLESQKYKGKMTTDGGDNNNVYEVGSSLTLLH